MITSNLPKLKRIIRYLSFIGHDCMIPKAIYDFCNQIVEYSKSNELKKRSSWETVRRSYL